jgi:hypothetical protein
MEKNTNQDQATETAQSLIDQLANATKPPAPPIMEALPGNINNMPDGFEASTPADETFTNDFAPEPPPPPATPDGGDALVAVTYPPDKLAPVVIDMADALIQALMPSVYTNTLDKKDAKALKLLGKKVTQQFEAGQGLTLTPEELRVLDISKEYEAYKDSLPLEDAEKKTLLAPLKEVLKDAKYETTPGTALIMAAGIVMLPRCLPLLANKMSKTE